MANQLGTGVSSNTSGLEAGRQAALSARSEVTLTPQLGFVFASPTHDLTEVLKGVAEVFGDTPVIGCSSAGEFTADSANTSSVVVALIGSDHMAVQVGVARGLSGDLTASLSEIESQFSRLPQDPSFAGRTLFLFTDGLAGRGEEIIEELMERTNSRFQLFGGAAGDDAQFKRTWVFNGTEVLTDALICAAVLSTTPFGVALAHGWQPVGDLMRVTDAAGAQLHQLNGGPAWEYYQDFAGSSGVVLSDEDAPAFLMSHILGIWDGEEHHLRVPLQKTDDGSLICAAEVPTMSRVHIMESDSDAMIASGSRAAAAAQQALGNQEIAGALVMECVATRLLLGDRFKEEVSALATELGAPLAGCNSYGQLARIEGSFVGLMDATALVCAIPKE